MSKNIIFDWSGVIKDCIESHLWVVNKMFKGFGINELSMEELKENWEQPYMLFFNKYLPDLNLKDEQIAYRKAILDKDCPKSRIYPGIDNLIKELKKRGDFLGVITSDFPITIYPEIKSYGLEDIFNEILMDIYDKAGALNDLIKKRNLDPKDTFFIGDSTQEIKAGKGAGIKTVAVTWGFDKEKKLKTENPDFLAKDINELEKILYL
jgi:phosphoglycolate phosphatase